MTSVKNTEARGSGLLAVFCDLDPQWVAEFRPWLARDMFPPRIAIGLGPAASFDLIPDRIRTGRAQSDGSAHAYVTLYVAPSLGELYGAPYQGLRTKRAPLDAAYHQRMQNQARYSASRVGLGIDRGPVGYAPVLVFDRFDLSASDIQSFNIWYETEYLPACLDVPGLSRVTRYLSMEGEHGHLLVHEFDDPGDLVGDAWQRLRVSDNWNVCTFAPGTPAAYRRIIAVDRG